MGKLKSVLIIDDDEINNFILSKVIKKADFSDHIHWELDGERGLNYLRNLKANGNGTPFPDLIFLDIRMPLMDGFGFLDVYEKELWTHNPDTKLFMLSSSISNKDKTMAMNYKAVTAYLTKPFTVETLQSLSQKYFS